MYHDPGHHDCERQAPQSDEGFLRHSDECKLLFDSMEAVARCWPERETQRVMDGLLRECLRREPLVPRV
jgi:hypothetical protein